MAHTDTPITFLRSEYKAPAFLIQSVDLDIALNPARTIVVNRMQVKRHEMTATHEALVLHGEEQELVSVRVNGTIVTDYVLTPQSLTLNNLPDVFELSITSACVPEKNTSLMGLYVSNGNFFTQCEAEGFRKITYFLDRPDVMATYQVTLRALKAHFPVLLSNGNLIKEEELGNGWHAATWQDPFPKPSYLFALVAGKLQAIERTIKSSSGKSKLLQVWVESKDLDKTEHAMDSLVASIRWDEQRFGLELDLDRFMIVAVGDFNMGAMENKGLNIFNTKFVLANPETATDVDYGNIESVVAHEYFHNWTGNRVTCRDWFQLSLKEGLTVFRDQEFSADQMGHDSGKAVKRIEDVRLLRQVQFPEDAGPMAHPIRPDSYQEINNFYTVTVYEKGAEVVRMQQTLLGKEGFRKGMDLYFKRHDGQAVTCDDFTAAMADANGKDLTQFKNWYSQAGTPKVTIEESFHQGTYQAKLSQSCPSTPDQANKAPFHIPLLYKLIGAGSTDLGAEYAVEKLFELTQTSETITVHNLKEKPVLSINRNFSAPIVLDFEQHETELLTLVKKDDDAFNRWEAIQKLYIRSILNNTTLDTTVIDTLREVLLDSSLDPAFKDLIFTLPAETYLYEQVHIIDPQAIHLARRQVREQLAVSLSSEWMQVYQQHQTPGEYQANATSAGRRALKNLALNMLMNAKVLKAESWAYEQYQSANNMTDRYGALASLVNFSSSKTEICLADFKQRFMNDALVIDKWFTLQATRQEDLSGKSPVLADVLALRNHPDFHIQNPNRARSLIHAFCMSNPGAFHNPNGESYQFWAKQVIELNQINPQVASRLARSLDRWKQFAPNYQQHMKSALELIAREPHLSSDVAEVVQKALHS
jgi:aminopeptidase N